MKDLKQQIDEILLQHREWMRGIRTDRLIGTSNEETQAKLLALFNEAVSEIIGEDLSVKVPYKLAELQKAFENGANMTKAEQRLKQKEVLS